MYDCFSYQDIITDFNRLILTLHLQEKVRSFLLFIPLYEYEIKVQIQ